MKYLMKKLFGRTKTSCLNNGNKTRNTVCNLDEFFDLIEIERSRSHRENSVFSLILIKVGKIENNTGAINKLIDRIRKRIRRIDRIGWYGKDYIGVLLPNTNNIDANRIADELLNNSENNYSSLQVDLLTYPSKN